MHEHFFEVRGLKLHARVRPDSSEAGPLTLLLHGWLDHAGSFDLLAPLLPGRTAALDFRGHGDSAWVGPGGFYHFIDYLADIDGAIEALTKPGEPVRIVGHSMGAASALLYIASRPERVTSLTLIDALPILAPVSDVPGRVTQHLADLRSYSRERRPVKSVEDAAQRLMRNNASLTPAVARILAEGNVGETPNGLAWKWDPLLRARSPLPVTEAVVQALVAQIKQPLLVLRAEKGILPPEPELHARFPSLKLDVQTIPGTGHHLHLDAPQEVARRILAAG